MAFKGEGSPRGIELRNGAFAKLSSPSDSSEDQTHDIDARRLALLGKKQRLQVGWFCTLCQETLLDKSTLRQRRFDRVSLVAFSTTLLASWESIAWYVSNLTPG